MVDMYYITEPESDFNFNEMSSNLSNALEWCAWFSSRGVSASVYKVIEVENNVVLKQKVVHCAVNG